MLNRMADLFDYETLVEEALRGVVKTALKQVEKSGLVEDHHFFITFLTDYEGVSIPKYLKDKYPEEMTIVLQYQFDNLVVKEDQFAVTLSFNNVPERMTVPFDAITGFADPSVKFGLQFHVSIDEFDLLDDELLESDDDDFQITEAREEKPAPSKKTVKGKAKKGEAESQAKKTDNVVSLDTFRKG